MRSGTLAEKMPGDVDKATVKQREKQLQLLNKQFKNKFLNSNINTEHTMLVETVDENFSFGYTDNYIYIKIPAQHNVGEIINVKLTKDMFVE